MAPQRYLIIDDDPAVLRMLQRLITDHGLGEVVGTAANARTGEEMARSLTPDIVIIDLLMPQQDGLETIRRLRGSGFNGRFVMLSQVTDKGMVARAYEVDVEFYITKPINVVETVRVLRRVSEYLIKDRVLQQIRQSLKVVEGGAGPGGGATPVSAAPSPAAGAEDAGYRARHLMADLGVLGSVGAGDLLLLAELAAQGIALETTELQSLYRQLAQAKRDRGEPADNPRAIEQRLRRTATAALAHLAAMGLEDYGDPRFERLAGRFFSFPEVRAQMQQLRSGRGPGGRVNLKQFLSAFLFELNLDV